MRWDCLAVEGLGRARTRRSCAGWFMGNAVGLTGPMLPGRRKALHPIPALASRGRKRVLSVSRRILRRVMRTRFYLPPSFLGAAVLATPMTRG